jgi:colanic acid biosynthesis glycosyl transferase WcaI
LIPNGVQLEQFSEASGGDAFRMELELQGKFVVGYVGTHGMAHRLQTVIEAAQILKSHADIHFLFVGDGAEKQKLEQYARELGLNNITFNGQVSRARIASVYQACDVCLVPLRQAELFTKNIPSKIYEIMASRRPLILSAKGESLRLVERAGAGIGATPEDPQDLASKILFLHSRPELRKQLGQDGYTFALANCSRTRLADQYLKLLNGMVSGSLRESGLTAASAARPIKQDATTSRESVTR